MTPSHAIDPDKAYCWCCGVWRPGSTTSDDRGQGNGWGHGSGDGSGFGDGDGFGNGGPLPLCDDPLACAVRQAGSPT